MYRPLPDSLTIKNSEVDGLGLFATEDIPTNTNLGASHIEIHSRWIRTPIGGFYNHSDDPNCIKKSLKNVFKNWMELVTIKPIKAGEELTVEYTLYKVK